MFVDVDTVRLFATDEGIGGPPILFVHGWTCDSHDWTYQLPAFTDRRVIAVDLRGHGRSSVPDGGYTAKQMAADVAALLGQLETGPVVAVGHSMGGAVVTALAVEHAQLVAGCVNVDPALGLPAGFDAVVMPTVPTMNAAA